MVVLLLTLGVTETDLKKEIRNFYATYGTDGVVTYQEARKWVSAKNHTRRLFALNETFGAIFDDAFDAFGADFRNHLRNIILKEADFFKVAINPDDILEMVWGTDGRNWYQRLFAYRDKWTKVLGNDLKMSFLKRSSLPDVVGDVGDRFVSMDKLLRNLCVSESTAIRSLARREIFIKMGIKNYQFYAQADERTCDECGALHGQIFPMTAFEVGLTASPLHSYCRCWEVPIFD